MIAEYLSELFESHGMPCVVDQDWVFPNSRLPAIRGVWYPGESNAGELDVTILVREGVVIEECFGGFGEDDKASLRDSLYNFVINDFHVLLAAFWGKNEHEQIEIEHWEITGKRYTAYLGNFGRRVVGADSADVPSDLFPRIEETIRQEHLTNEIHWFRFFCGNLGNIFTYEALKDNEDWEAGIRCLESVQWSPCEVFYSVRLFLILRAI